MIDPLQDIGGNVFAWLCDKERENNNTESRKDTDNDCG